MKLIYFIYILYFIMSIFIKGLLYILTLEIHFPKKYLKRSIIFNKPNWNDSRNQADCIIWKYTCTYLWNSHFQGRIQDFKLGGGGGALKKKLHRAEGGAKMFGVFRVKNHDFTPKKSYFFPILGMARAGCAPLDPPLIWCLLTVTFTLSWWIQDTRVSSIVCFTILVLPVLLDEEY